MSESVFLLHVLPAGIGDALVLDYGTVGDTHRVVIDGGTTKTAPGLAEFLAGDDHIELIVVTHIDNDHIGGMLKVLDVSDRLTVGDVWFNGFRHLPKSPLQSMGPVEGERLTTHIVQNALPWNASFGGQAVMVHPAPKPTATSLPGGLALTVLSPGHDQLNELRKKWLPVVQEGGLDPAAPVVEENPIPAGRLERMGAVDVEALAASATQCDRSEANGSSIAVLAEWAGRSCLLTGDAHADVLLSTLDCWGGPGSTLDVDLLKLAHHGSKANVTSDLMKRIRAGVYVFSSSGEGRSQHPNDEAAARAILHSPPGATMAFNYRSKRTEPWDDAALKARYEYETLYPTDGSEHGGLTIDLMKIAKPTVTRVTPRMIHATRREP